MIQGRKPTPCSTYKLSLPAPDPLLLTSNCIRAFFHFYSQKTSDLKYDVALSGWEHRADSVMRYTVIAITLSELRSACYCTYTVSQQSSRAMYISMKLLLWKITTNAFRVIVYWGSAWKFKALHFKRILLFSGATGSFCHRNMHKCA